MPNNSETRLQRAMFKIEGDPQHADKSQSERFQLAQAQVLIWQYVTDILRADGKEAEACALERERDGL